MDIFKRYTPAELKDARADFERVDPAVQHMIAESNDDFFAKFETPVDEIRIDASRPLTLTEKAAVDAEQNVATIFGGIYVPKQYSSIPALASLEKAKEKENVEKLLGHQPRAQTPFDQMIEEAVAQAVVEMKKRYEREPLAVPTPGASGARIVFDADVDESTEYSSSGALV